jgi:predicted amidohydrolase YtcJ
MKVYEGAIVTCDHQNSVARYLVEDQGKITFVGDSLPEAWRSAPAVRLQGRALLPAFGDTHLHFSSYSLFASTIDVRDCRDHGEVCEQVAAYAAAHPGKMVIGYGASAHSVAERSLITRGELDRVCPAQPVMLVKYDGHAAIINSALIRKLPPAIQAMRGFNGESGEMNQDAFFAVTNFVTGKVSPLDLMNSMLAGVDRLAAQGVGLIHPVEGVGFPMDLDVDLVRFLARGLNNRLTARVYFQTMDVAKVLRRKLPRIGGCFATALDGCFGSEDAALLEPYTNNPANRGVLFYGDETVQTFVKKANRAGLQVSMHAIGDAAVVQAVNAIDAALQDYPRQDHRHVVIHASLAPRRELERMARLGICVAAQPALLDWPQEPLEYSRHILGSRAETMLPLRDMLDLGIHVGGGTDAPCSLPDPVRGIATACNHYNPALAVSIPEALRMFTSEVAYLSFDEKRRGTLTAGNIADMTILSENPLAMKPQELRRLKIEQLILAGRDYQPGQGLGSLLVGGITGRNKSRL